MTALTYQPSMLDISPQPGLGDLDRLRRHDLSGGAWVDVRSAWIAGSDEVFRTLVDGVRWRAERRRMYDADVAVPRLLRWYGQHDQLPHPLLTQARDSLSDHYRAELGEAFTTAGMCLYRDGRDSVAWHGDTLGRSATTDTVIAIVSFGSPRALLLRPRSRAGADGDDTDSSSMRFTLGHGDLLVMGGSCQRTWEHAVPKTARVVGPRISVQFRPAGVA